MKRTQNDRVNSLDIISDRSSEPNLMIFSDNDSLNDKQQPPDQRHIRAPLTTDYPSTTTVKDQSDLNGDMLPGYLTVSPENMGAYVQVLTAGEQFKDIDADVGLHNSYVTGSKLQGTLTVPKDTSSIFLGQAKSLAAENFKIESAKRTLEFSKFLEKQKLLKKVQTSPEDVEILPMDISTEIAVAPVNSGAKKAEIPKGREFESWEKSFCNSNLKSLKCMHPGCGALNSLKNHGLGGNPNQGGFKLTQIRCKSCQTNSRLADLLRKNGKPELALEHDNKVAEYQCLASASKKSKTKAKSTKESQKILTFLKRKRDEPSVPVEATTVASTSAPTSVVVEVTPTPTVTAADLSEIATLKKAIQGLESKVVHEYKLRVAAEKKYAETLQKLTKMNAELLKTPKGSILKGKSNDSPFKDSKESRNVSFAYHVKESEAVVEKATRLIKSPTSILKRAPAKNVELTPDSTFACTSKSTAETPLVPVVAKPKSAPSKADKGKAKATVVGNVPKVPETPKSYAQAVVSKPKNAVAKVRAKLEQVIAQTLDSEDESDAEWIPVQNRKGKKGKPQNPLPIPDKVVAQQPQTKKAKNYKKIGRSLLKKQDKPLEFTRVHFQVLDNRPIKKCKNFHEVKEVIRGLFADLKIKKSVVEFSMIGKSIIEMYVKTDHMAKVEEALASHDIKLDFNMDLTAPPEFAKVKDPQGKLVSRLGFLYKQARLQNLRECILENLTQELKEAVVAAAGEKPKVVEQEIIVLEENDVEMALVTDATVTGADTDMTCDSGETPADANVC
jgi:hypothetical protein